MNSKQKHYLIWITIGLALGIIYGLITENILKGLGTGAILGLVVAMFGKKSH